MATTIKLKNSVTTTNTPSSLAQGEVAINITDKKVWVGNAATTPIQIVGAGTTGNAAGSNTQVQYNSSGSFAGSANFTFNGTTVTMANDASISGLTVGKGTGSAGGTTVVGNGAVAATNTGDYLTAVGQYSLAANTSGTQNSGFGRQSLQQNTSGSYNTALGHTASYSNTTGSNNVSVGRDALYSNTTASNNTAVGYKAGYALTTGGNNVLMGYYGGIGAAGEALTTATANTFIGPSAGYLVTTGSKNTFLGAFSGNSGSLDLRTTSNYIVLSDGDGNPRQVIDGSGNVFVGSTSIISSEKFGVTQSANSQVVSIYAKNASYTSDAFVIYADRNTTNNTFYVLNYFNGGAAAYKFRVADSGNVTNTNGSYGTISDIKNKENIVDATSKLDKVNQLKVRNYNFIGDDLKQIGFVAQEFEQVFPSMVEEHKDTDKDGNDLGTTTKSIKTSVLVPILVKAVQELTAKVEALEAQLNK
jgi:hypothetical protein